MAVAELVTIGREAAWIAVAVVSSWSSVSEFLSALLDLFSDPDTTPRKSPGCDSTQPAKGTTCCRPVTMYADTENMFACL